MALVIAGRSPADKAKAEKNKRYWDGQLAHMQGLLAVIDRYIKAGHRGYKTWWVKDKAGNPVYEPLSMTRNRVSWVIHYLKAAQKTGWVTFNKGLQSIHNTQKSRGKLHVLRLIGHLQRVENAKAAREKRAPVKLPNPFKPSGSGSKSRGPVVPQSAEGRAYMLARQKEWARLRGLGYDTKQTAAKLRVWTARYLVQHLPISSVGGGKPSALGKPSVAPVAVVDSRFLGAADRAPVERGVPAPKPRPGPVINPDPWPYVKPTGGTCNCVTHPCNCDGKKPPAPGPMPPEEAPMPGKMSLGVEVGVSLVVSLLFRFVLGG